MKTTIAILALSLLAAACTRAVEYRYQGSGQELLKNDQGHVIGQKEMLRDPTTGGVWASLGAGADVVHPERGASCMIDVPGRGPGAFCTRGDTEAVPDRHSVTGITL